MRVPQEALDEVGRALRVGDDLEAAGMRVSLDAHPVTSRPTATLHEVDGTLRVLALSVLADADALRRAALGAVDGLPG